MPVPTSANPPAAAAASSGSLISSLPSQALSRILLHLESPLDLYHASLVNHDWRAAATSPRLWQPHYWTFYRAQLFVQSDEDRLLLECRTRSRRAAMRAWIEKSTRALPPSPLGPLARMTASGEMLLYEPLEKGILMINSMNGQTRIIETAHRFSKIVKEQYGDRGPDDLEEAAQRIIGILVKETGKLPTQQDIDHAEWAYHIKANRLEDKFNFPETAPSYPPFLSDKDSEAQDLKPLPDFHTIFVKRLNQDELLIRDLRTQIGLEGKTLDGIFTLIDKYGDRARDLLIAICAEQQLSTGSVGLFAASPGIGGSDSKKDWPHALDVHVHAASGEPRPRLGHCVALEYAAQQMLGHLQRRESIRSIRQLVTRFQAPLPKDQSLRDRILRCCVGVEEAMEDLALFRLGERSECGEFIGLLALYVIKDIEARARVHGIGPLDAEPPSEFDDPSAHRFPSGSTRLFMGSIERSLRRLGFATAIEDTGLADDFENSFLNTSLFCPAQRTTSPIIMLSILCAVARRLGIAATPVSSPKYPMAIVLEDGEKPDDWYGVDEDWHRFYWMPSRNGNFCMYERSDVLELLAKTPPSSRGYKDPKAILEPATPPQVLIKAAEEMLLACKQGKRKTHPRLDGEDMVEQHHDPSVMRTARLGGSAEQLTMLRDYLWGRTGSLPWPLLPPVLPASLALLPPTKASFPRVNLPDLKKLSSYAAWWVIRLADPSRAGGPDRVDKTLADAIHGHAYLAPDWSLIYMARDVEWKPVLEKARVKARKAEEDGSSLSKADIFASDAASWLGLGGSGGSPAGGERAKELLNPAHPRNAAVEYGVGTIFKHAKHGWRAVVYGWDATCRQAAAAAQDGVTIDPSPSGGRNQPHYYCFVEDGSRFYVPQSSIQVARVPAGSTAEQANSLLREYVGLFRLRGVARCFRTITVAPWKAKAKGGSSGGSGSGQVKMLLTPWMRKAWPFG